MSDVDEIEQLVRAAMRRRAEPRGGLRGAELAAAAMARAVVAEGHAARLAKVARWMRITSVAAGILLVIAIGVGGYFYRADLATDSGGQSGVTAVITDGAEEGTSVGAGSLDMAAVGWMMLGAVVVGLAVKVVMVPERQGFGMGYA